MYLDQPLAPKLVQVSSQKLGSEGVPKPSKAKRARVGDGWPECEPAHILSRRPNFWYTFRPHFGYEFRPPFGDGFRPQLLVHVLVLLLASRIQFWGHVPYQIMGRLLTKKISNFAEHVPGSRVRLGYS